jgi:two-component system OmpR family sensor kinase
MIDSVRTKLTLWYTGILALALVAFSVSVYLVMANQLAARFDRGLQTALDGTARLFIHEKDERETDQHAASSALRKHYAPHQAVALYDAQGQLILEKMLPDNVRAVLPEHFTTLAANGSRFFTLSEAQTGADDGLRLLVQRLAVPPQAVYYITAAEPRTELDQSLELLRDIFLFAVPLALLLAGVSGWFLARKSLAPVVMMAESARRISAENLNERLPVPNPRDELGQLAGTFNELLARLDAAFVQQRQFMADASHELRTPLSVLRTAAAVTLEQPQRPEAEYREALALMHEQARRLTRIVEEMFTLARADAGRRPIAAQDFYLDELVAETARAASVLAERKQIALHLAPLHETPFRGDEDLLRQLLLNLLDNAIKFTPQGGAISLTLESNGGGYHLTVADTGGGIPAEAQARIFERFFRVDKARSRADQEQGGGAGLGLSIARWIAEAHGGALRLARSDQHGSTFVVNLPAEPAP